MNLKASARIVGVLVIIATAAPLVSVAFVPALFGPADVANVWLLAENEGNVRVGTLLEFAMAVAIAGIPIWMYPILKKQNESMALGYVAARLIEGLMFTVGVICLLTLVALSKEYALAGAPDIPYYQTLGALVLAVRSVQSIFAQFAFGMGSLMAYYLMYKSRLIPRWLSGWGLVGSLLFFASAFLPMFGYGSESTVYLLLNVPGGLEEMVFAVWLIVKGFNPSAINPPLDQRE